MLGVMLTKGRLAAQDDQEASAWFRRAATQGHMAAQVNLGTLYRQGRGVSQNYQEAPPWYQMAADQGSWETRVGLGDLSLQGLGVSKYLREAVHAYRDAAESGASLGQAKLGVLYYRGEGIHRDLIQPFMWLTPAGTQGLLQALKLRNVVASEMTTDQVALAIQMARRWAPHQQKKLAGSQPSSQR